MFINRNNFGNYLATLYQIFNTDVIELSILDIDKAVHSVFDCNQISEFFVPMKVV